MSNRVYLHPLFVDIKAAKRVRRGATRLLGQRIGDLNKPMIDADNDGKCRERRGGYVPCPPGVNAGTVLRNGVPVKRRRFDLRPGGGIDDISGISKAHQQKMSDKLKEIGLTEDQIKEQTRSALKRASKQLIDGSKTWYKRVNSRTKDMVNELNTRNGTSYTTGQGAGVIAALSPMREFGKNVRDAKKLLTVVAEDKEFDITPDVLARFRKDKAKLQQVINRSQGRVRPSDFKDDELDLLAAVHPTLSKIPGKSGFGDVIKALAITRGKDPGDVLSGPKVRSFYSNIVDPEGDRTTIDTWMYRVMIPPDVKLNYKDQQRTLEELKKAKVHLQKIFQESPQSAKDGIPKGVGLYPIFSQVIREIAAENNLSPAALQAILWEVARTDAGYKPTKWEKVLEEFNI